VELTWNGYAKLEKTSPLSRLLHFALMSFEKFNPYYADVPSVVSSRMGLSDGDTKDNVKLVAVLDTPNPALILNLSEAESVQFRRTLRISFVFGLKIAASQIY
jgi:hypothetical protein